MLLIFVDLQSCIFSLVFFLRLFFLCGQSPCPATKMPLGLLRFFFFSCVSIAPPAAIMPWGLLRFFFSCVGIEPSHAVGLLRFQLFSSWWGNSHTKFIILKIKFRFTCGESILPLYYFHDCPLNWFIKKILKRNHPDIFLKKILDGDTRNWDPFS